MQDSGRMEKFPEGTESMENSQEFPSPVSQKRSRSEKDFRSKEQQ